MYALSQIFTVTEPADCPSDATWCTAMRVKNTTTTTSIAKYDFSGYNISGPRGALGSTTFSHESTSYTVTRLEQTTLTALPADTISFRTFFLKAAPPLPAGTILKLGNRSFTVGADSEDSTVGQEQWNTLDNRLDWTNRQTVTVSLTLPDGGQTNHVPSNWSLKPNGLTAGDEFRLLFLSSTKRKATPSDIAVYNAWIQELVADGHADILAYSSGFTAVGCTEDTDARDNTSTTYTVTARGAPIYWLDGDLVAVDYADFYDGTWQDETNPKNESGTNGPDTSVSDNYPITGCNHDGTENVVSGNSLALGSAPIRVAVPGVSNPGTGPLSSSSNLAAPTANRPMYGLSAVFIVTETSTDVTLSDLTIEGITNGETVSLQPTFKASNFTYTITVSNRIDHITVIATTNDNGATVVIAADDDTSTPNEAEMDLSVGDNTLTFTVTAEDNSVTQTYTLTVTRTEPRPEPTQVLATWSLVPDGLGINDEFRLLFLSSTKRHSGTNSGGNIGHYNTFIKDLVAAGHPDIQAYKSNFRMVGCTQTIDARDNTGTTYTSDDKGVPIYWLNGNKVVDDYEDFYDGDWDEERFNKDESGSAGFDPLLENNYPVTGCDHDGTEAYSNGASTALSTFGPTLGQPDSGGGGPLSSATRTSLARPMYGLSGVFKVSDPADATLSDLTIEGITNGETVSLEPTFNANDFTYTIAVSNGIDQITVTATTNDGDATVVIAGDDDTSTPHTADLSLSVGDNTLTFTVTAEDASVTQTYTLTVTRTEPRPEPTQIPPTWSLIPDGLGINDEFRLLFLSSTKRHSGTNSGGNIGHYNTFIKDLVAAGHPDIQAYKSNFRMVGCTQTIDARDNTGTTYTSDDKGVPIYWLNGNKVVDDYEDFYDGDWDEERFNKDESGSAGFNTLLENNYPVTGCDHDGTEAYSGGASTALSTLGPTLGQPDSGGGGPLSSATRTSLARPMYGLSGVFKVSDPTDATLSDLAIQGTPNGETVELNPPFDEDTFTYTAAVGHRIDEVKLTVTSNNNNATIVIAGDDDTSTSNEAEMDLNVGSNTLTITVTAEDTTTTMTYTVTLRRARQTAPDAPTGLMATANGTSDINLEWTEPAYNGDNAISGYKIEYSANGNSDWTVLLADTGSADTTYSDTGLDPRTTRHYRVFAINSIGTGPKSNIANATTDASPTPAQVTGVNVTPSNGALSVRWTAVSDATGYKVRWKSGGQNYNAGREASITSGSTNNYTISGLNNGTQYLVTSHRHQDGRERRTAIAGDVRHTITHPPSVTFGPGSFTASENGATARVTVELSVPAADDVTIPLRVQHRNGATSADYSGVPRRLIFEDGNTIRSFTVAAVDDSENDDGEKIEIEF